MICAVCGKTSFVEWCHIKEYAIFKCIDCGTGITCPFPGEDILLETNVKIYDVNARVRDYTFRRKYFEKRYNRYISRIRLIKNTGILLDIGCNIGLFMRVAQRAGFIVRGIEPNENCAAYGKDFFHLDIDTRYLEACTFPSETFDVITLFDVLEHIPNLHIFLSEVRRVLKRDGLIVIQSPNIDSLMSCLTKARWFWLTPPDHVYHFTPGALRHLLVKYGYSVCSMTTWEPAADFSDNLLAAYFPTGLFGSAIRLVLKITRLFFILVFFLQKIWWRKERGGLIEVYATKSC